MKRLLICVAVLSSVVTACNNPKTGSSSSSDTAVTAGDTKADMLQRNKDAALRNVHAVMNHDTAAFVADLAPDVVDYLDGSGTPIKGADSVKASLLMYLNAFPDLRGENLMAIAEDNHVAVFGDYSGTFKANLMGMKPTGKTFHMKDVDLFTFNDEGKITEHRSVQSFSTVMMQVGAAMK